MLKKIKTSNLKVGMFVKIPAYFANYISLPKEFKIQLPAQIRKLKNSKLDKVYINLQKSETKHAIEYNHYERVISHESGLLNLENLDQKPHGKQHSVESPYRKKRSAKNSKSAKSNFVEFNEKFSARLKTTLNSDKIDIQGKSDIIYHTLQFIMKKILDLPTYQNLNKFRKSLVSIVEIILEYEKLLPYLLNSISHEYTAFNHSVNVGLYSLLLTRALLKKSEEEHDIHKVAMGFFLHDIGRTIIDNSIFNKPGALTSGEYKIVKTHPTLGYKLLANTESLCEETKIIVLQHHERFDGSGYPRALKNNRIHLYGRICSIADVYDALTSDRPYRKRLKPYHALELMKQEMPEHFQEDLFSLFVLLFK